MTIDEKIEKLKKIKNEIFNLQEDKRKLEGEINESIKDVLPEKIIYKDKQVEEYKRLIPFIYKDSTIVDPRDYVVVKVGQPTPIAEITWGDITWGDMLKPLSHYC